MKILIIQQKMIGDVLTSSVLFEALKTKYPDSELHYLINSHTYPVVEHNPFIDNLIFVTPEIEQSRSGFFKLARHIRKMKFDAVIDVFSIPTSTILACMSKAKLKIGYKKWYNKFCLHHGFNYKSQPNTNAGLAIENRLLLLAPFNTNFPETVKPKIYLTSAEIAHAKKVITGHGINLDDPLFMIGVLGSSLEKSYPLHYLAQVLDQIVKETNAKLLLNYIPSQLETVNQLISKCHTNTQKHIAKDIYGKSLREFLALTSQCSALIGNEGGAINMAKALDIPTFSIFSPFIKKSAWSLFEGEKNVSVHLSDYHSELYETLSLKKVRSQADHYYAKFKPALFSEKLNTFLKLVR